MGGKFVDEFSFKVVVYQRTLVQKVRITQNLKFVVKYEDFNMEQLTALVILMQLIFHLMLKMVYLLHMELILVIIYSRTPLDAQRVDPVGSSSECPCQTVVSQARPMGLACETSQTGATSVFPKF